MRRNLSAERYYVNIQSVSIKWGAGSCQDSKRVGAHTGQSPRAWTISLSSDGRDHACLTSIALCGCPTL